MRRIDHMIGVSDALRRLAAAAAKQHALIAAVTDALPPDVAAHCVSATLEGAELHLLVDSPAWATRLRYLSGELRHRLRGRWRVDTVAVRVEPAHQPPAPRAARRAELSAAAADAIAASATGIEDPGLKAALLRLSRHGRR